MANEKRNNRKDTKPDFQGARRQMARGRTMRLYLIKRKSDRKFFVSINGYYMLTAGGDGRYFSDKPQMFLKTPEGVAGNLRKLCSEPYWYTTPPKGLCSRLKSNWRELAWRNFDESKLSGYEVIVMDVDILSMKATPATEFIQIKAVRDIPLNRHERQKEDAQ